MAENAWQEKQQLLQFNKEKLVVLEEKIAKLLTVLEDETEDFTLYEQLLLDESKEGKFIREINSKKDEELEFFRKFFRFFFFSVSLVLIILLIFLFVFCCLDLVRELIRFRRRLIFFSFSFFFCFFSKFFL